MINLANFSSIFIANWKLNGNIDFIKEYYQKLLTNPNNCVIICSSPIYLNKLSNNEKNLFSGAQDVSIHNEGAYTGELSAKMLSDCKIKFCIVGHSERRQNFNENNETVSQKSKNLIENNIIPIICIGETLEQKRKKLTKRILANQISQGLYKIKNKKKIIIAYEPVWSIGSGLIPREDDLFRTVSFIKKKVRGIKVLYGGSVNRKNIKDLKKINNLDGFLIGGESQISKNFIDIIKKTFN